MTRQRGCWGLPAVEASAVLCSKLCIGGSIQIVSILLTYDVHMFKVKKLYAKHRVSRDLRDALQCGGPVSNHPIIRATARLMNVAGISPASTQDPALDRVLARNNLRLSLGSAVGVDDYIVNVFLAYIQHIQTIDTHQLRSARCGYDDAEQVPPKRPCRTSGQEG